MKVRTINLPKSERFACSTRELKATFSDLDDLDIYCGFLGKSFAFDSRSRKRPRLKGTIVVQAQVSRTLGVMLILYVLRRNEYPDAAANEFCGSIIHEIHDS